MNEYIYGNTHSYPPTHNILYNDDDITKKNRANITKKKIRAADVYTHRHRHRHRQTNAHMNEYIYGNTHSYPPTHNIHII